MNKPIIQSASDIINSPSLDDRLAIKLIATSVYPKVVKAIEEYKENKGKAKDEEDKTPIITGDEIRQMMERPLMNDTRITENVQPLYNTRPTQVVEQKDEEIER